jgi:hypothetical protein
MRAGTALLLASILLPLPPNPAPAAALFPASMYSAYGAAVATALGGGLAPSAVSVVNVTQRYASDVRAGARARRRQLELGASVGYQVFFAINAASAAFALSLPEPTTAAALQVTAARLEARFTALSASGALLASLPLVVAQQAGYTSWLPALLPGVGFLDITSPSGITVALNGAVLASPSPSPAPPPPPAADSTNTLALIIGLSVGGGVLLCILAAAVAVAQLRLVQAAAQAGAQAGAQVPPKAPQQLRLQAPPPQLRLQAPPPQLQLQAPPQPSPQARQTPAGRSPLRPGCDGPPDAVHVMWC